MAIRSFFKFKQLQNKKDMGKYKIYNFLHYQNIWEIYKMLNQMFKHFSYYKILDKEQID